MKKVLGLDLGTTSIGWALVNQAENTDEKSSIIKVGVRVNPLTTDEKGSFESGKAITTNADRRVKRGMRRNMSRYKLRRDNLKALLRDFGWITDDTILSEDGKGTTYETLKLRAKAATEEISLVDLARVLLTLNKKRGYKSNRKTDRKEDGIFIDGIKVAKELHEKGMTPGQYSRTLLESGKKTLPDYYPSDLELEYDLIWTEQSKYWPDILTDDLRKQLSSQGRQGVAKVLNARYGVMTADNKGKDKTLNEMRWRSDALSTRLEKEVLFYVLAALRGEISNSSGYLGNISDHSKELAFNHQTVGQYIYGKIRRDKSYSTKNVVFYRQDYIDEFETIWRCQSQFHSELTDDLKGKIKDRIIFYQRNLKSQKGLVSLCEFERRPVSVTVDGKTKSKIVGLRVAPRSSFLFQEFKVWSVLNNVLIVDKDLRTSEPLDEGEKETVAKELSIRAKMSAADFLKALGKNPRKFDLNYKSIEGNATMSELYSKFFDVVEASGNGDAKALGGYSYHKAISVVTDIFSGLGFNTDILRFNSDLPKEEYEKQPIFKLWHLIYSYEGDKSRTGNDSLVEKVSAICGMPEEYAKIIASARFLDDYASLSHKAISKILPYLKAGNTYDLACAYAGYSHSESETKEERDSKRLKEKLELIPKGELRNPVVEKILNQMVNVVNMVSDAYGKPDEIHVELARALKQNQKQREKATKDIESNNKKNEEIKKILQDEFHLSYVSKNDILRYKLYKELEPNGYKTLYSGKKIYEGDLFSKSIDIEHIIPQALLFDDSYSNKTLEYRDINIDKGRKTAFDYVEEKFDVGQYKAKVEDLYKKGKISLAKRNKLLMREADIPADFVNRDLTNSQYIARKAMKMLKEYVRMVVPTNGQITARVREDWQLVDMMKELDYSKYERAGKARVIEKDDGSRMKLIENWTKRNDHRHHAMDALTVAFTRPSHIKALNTLNARGDDFRKGTTTYRNKLILVPPMPLDDLRGQFKKELESVLVSVKAKNKVATLSRNKIKVSGGERQFVQLTPRGALHEESVYGLRRRYETYFVPVGSRLTMEEILKVASIRQRTALLERLERFGGDPEKAFSGKNSIDRNPVYEDAAMTVVIPEKVKCVTFKEVYSIRKEIGPNLNVGKVMDSKAKRLIQERIDSYGGDAKKALANLDENPIWLDEKNHIPLRKVTIMENFDLVPIHSGKDKDGKPLTGRFGRPELCDYVNRKNNHHVALYLDEYGDVQERVVTFFEAVERKRRGEPIVDKAYNAGKGWNLLFSMKINEMFVFPNPETGFDPKEIDLMDSGNYTIISPNLFRVQKLSSRDYWFRHHLETILGKDLALRDVTWKRIRSINNMSGAVKVRINHIGQIVSVGEYD